MGISTSGVKLYLELYQRGFFQDVESVLDMGSQELHLTQKNFSELIQSAGFSDKDEKKISNLENWPGYPRCSTRPFYEMLGVTKYSCIDLNKTYGAIPHDLNLPLEDKSLWGKYDLVTDHGCNEHAFNVAEAYRTMHRLSKPQGKMIIIEAVSGGNGYYLFDLSFFEGMAAANNYKVLFSSYIISLHDNVQFNIPLNRELLNTIDWTKISWIGICYVFQKQSDQDFQYPYQYTYMPEIQKNFGYQFQFLPDPPTRTYVPMFDQALSSIGGKTLLKILLKRAIGRLKFT